ncbi:MBL fold metallo-hydrolase [Novosphingobium sp. ZW T3_23]|uniref:MBL fold metallo-hydrolase n=1 Tax=Novosphingobium sp. ZW T3_23 TaxID=3378084 RepID=UPI0038553650
MRLGLIAFALACTTGLPPASVLADASAGANPGVGAQITPPPAMTKWFTLGTMGGPIASASRSQPANLLLRGPDAYLIDCGAGAVERLAATPVRLQQVRGVVLSHLHFDHTAGLQAVLGLRFQTGVRGRLSIYGPPGTRALVDGLLVSMKPAVAAGYGLPGEPDADPADSVEVVELTDGSRFNLGDVAVTVGQNTHYSFASGSEADKQFKSLSFRFAASDRTIVYTGDTGPSPAVERLAKGADLLVSEMIDVESTVANVRRNTPDMSPAAMTGLTRHLSTHHLTPEQVGEMAARAGVKSVVVTHVVAPTATAGELLAYLARISGVFKGPAVIADDLDEF